MVKGVVLTFSLLSGLISLAGASIIIDARNDGENVELLQPTTNLPPEEEEPGHPCHRPCWENSPPMECYYSFQVESYSTMSKACYDCPGNFSHCFLPHCVPADGLKRSIQVVNRQLPGPTIEVCQGDRLIVDVTNLLVAESTTIHWHGQHHLTTPYMDGVPYVTQCPILPGSTFRYHYTATALGTHFWHSHIGLQKSEGVFGALVIRSPKGLDHHRDLYDIDEHIITILDWNHESGIDKFNAHHHSTGNNKPENILINGLGPYDSNHIDATINKHMPYALFTVEQNLRHRFRVINAGFLNCPIEISIDNHTMFIVSTDGNDIEPVKASSFVIYAGERFDFIVEMNQRINNYWIRFHGLLDCQFFNVTQKAILRYNGASQTEPGPNKYWANFQHDSDDNNEPAMVVNALNKGTESNDTIPIPLLKALEPDNEANRLDPDYKFYLSYDFYAKDNPRFHRKNLYGFYQVKNDEERLYTPQLNHITLKFPPFPLLPQRDSIGPNQFCNSSTVGNCKNRYCECTHVLQVHLGSVVELVMVDEGVTYDANHPFHLHGTAFRVIGMARVGKNVTVDEIKRLDETGQIERRLNGAPLKDTVTVPDGGYTIIRFLANNPGYWLFHCHLEFHVEIGMGLLFKVGEHEEMLPVPADFPRCGDWKPTGPPEIIPHKTSTASTFPSPETHEPAELAMNLKDIKNLASSADPSRLIFRDIITITVITITTLF